MIWSIVYVIAVLTANYTATWLIPLPLYGLLPLGTIIFGLTFTARDYVHRLGKRYVYAMIVITAISAFVMAYLLDIPFQIIIASVLAILIAESVDTEIYHKYLHRAWPVRVIVSNSFSIPVDTLLFNIIAFTGIFSIVTIIQISITDIVTKYIAGLLIIGIRRKE